MVTPRGSIQACGAALLSGAALLACAAVTGLGDYELVDADASVDAAVDAPASDAPALPDARDSSPPDAAAPCAPATCAPLAAPGFSLVLFGNVNATCPAEHDTTDVASAPVAGPAACACGDCVGTTSCTNGVITTNGGVSCNINHLTLGNANPGGCNETDGVSSKGTRVNPPPAQVGACTASASGVRGGVTTIANRICRPRAAACANEACNPRPGLVACLVADGEVPCPDAEDLRVVVGDDVAIACPACACSLSATCSGTVDFFPMNDCVGTPFTVPTGTCTTTQESQQIESYRWTGTATRTCTKGAAPAPSSLTLTSAKTVCCAQKAK